MFFNFFKTPEVRKFNHKPIYWDPEEDERKERRERIRQEIANERGNGTPKSTLRRGFLSSQREQDAQNSKTSVIRLALIIGLLFLAVNYMAM